MADKADTDTKQTKKITTRLDVQYVYLYIVKKIYIFFMFMAIKYSV